MQTDMSELPTYSNGLSDCRKNNLNTCRLCMLTGSTRMEPIFQEYIRAICKTSLAEKIASVTQLSPCEGDGLPPVVCQQCLFQLDVADAFIQRCKQSDISLRSLLTQEGALGEGPKRKSKRNLQPVTSIPADRAGDADFTLTDQSFEAVPKKESSECKLIPPALSSKRHTLPEAEALTEIGAEVASKNSTRINTKHFDSVDACKEGKGAEKEVIQESEPQRLKTYQHTFKCLVCSISCNDERALTYHLRSHGYKMNISSTQHLQPAINTPITTQQPSLANATPGIAVQRQAVTETKSADTPDLEASESECLARKTLQIAAQLCEERLAMEALQAVRKWQCSDCGLVMDGRTCDSRHLCRTFLAAPSPVGDGRPPVRVRLMHLLQQGQLNQLHKVPTVVLVRTKVPKAICTEKVTTPVEDQTATKPVEEEPVTKEGELKQNKHKSQPATRVCSRSFGAKNFLQERRKIELLQEIIELRQMKQRLKARLKPADSGEERAMQTVKLTQLKLKLQAKLQQPTPVVCSPDVSVQLALVDSGTFDADLLAPGFSGGVKSEPWVADEALVGMAPPRSKRRLQAPSRAQDVSSTSQADGFLGKVKTEPKSGEDEPEPIVGGVNYGYGFRNKKSRLKQSP